MSVHWSYKNKPIQMNGVQNAIKSCLVSSSKDLVPQMPHVILSNRGTEILFLPSSGPLNPIDSTGVG